jgi:hypothetical protein
MVGLPCTRARFVPVLQRLLARGKGTPQSRSGMATTSKEVIACNPPPPRTGRSASAKKEARNLTFLSPLLTHPHFPFLQEQEEVARMKAEMAAGPSTTSTSAGSVLTDESKFPTVCAYTLHHELNRSSSSHTYAHIYCTGIPGLRCL